MAMQTIIALVADATWWIAIPPICFFFAGVLAGNMLNR